MRMREGPSWKARTSGRRWLSRSMCAPISAVPKQHSASATARPPSLRSCADSARPAATISDLDLGAEVAIEIDVRADFGGSEAAFGERHGEAAIAKIVRRFGETGGDDFADGLLHAFVAVEIRRGRQAPKLRFDFLCLRCAVEANLVAGPCAAQQDHTAARVLERNCHWGSGFHQPHDADDGRGVDAAAEGFVVEADIAAGDGRVEEAAGLGHAFDGLDELGHDFGALGVAEVEAIGGGDGQRAHDGESAAAFGDGELRALARGEVSVAAVAIERHGDGRAGFLDADDGGVGLFGNGKRVGAHLEIVLFPDPAFGTDVGSGEQGGQGGLHVGFGGWGVLASDFRRRGIGAVVEGRLVGQFAVGDFGDDFAVVADAKLAVAGDDADLGGFEAPLLEDAEDFVLAAIIGHQQHALLALGEHDLVGRHAGFALRDAVKFDFDADFAAAAHLAGGAGQTGGAHILNTDDGAGLHGFEAGFEEKFLHEGIAHLHVGALLLGLFGELGRGHGGAVNAVAAGARADVDHGVADARRLGVEHVFLAADAEGEDVDQRVAVIAGFEDALAAHGGDAEAVAVVRDAGHDAADDAAVARPGRQVIQAAEAQRIHHGDGARAHGEDVAQDAADAGGGALQGFDEAGVIVRLDLEGDDVAAADIDDAGIFAGALHD